MGKAARTSRENQMGHTYMKQVLQRLAVGNTGQDLLEYALLIGLIALVTVLAVTNAGSQVNRIFTAIATSLAAVA